MTEAMKELIFLETDVQSKRNNTEHHTSEISEEQLIVRRGQPFKVDLRLTQPFDPSLYPLSIWAKTGSKPTEENGTLSCFGIPDTVKRSPSTKAVWKVDLQPGSMRQRIMRLIVTPPADAPIGEYLLIVEYREEKTLLPTVVLLFNPWCPDDSVYLSDEKERQEYVMNEDGIIFKGSGNYISPMQWDFGQFEDNMVTICMKILDLNHKHKEDPAADVAARSDPVYVGRVVSAMINSQDDSGILEGRWGDTYYGGKQPSHWSGSHTILAKWLNQNCHPVKYGQCWVFAGVMCAVMRFLGIPCRVVTNYRSAHDTNKNLTVDVYHADYGVREKKSHDSIWNYHVWCESWMKRPDLSKDGKFDGWQVLDPTPQEMSDGVFCCGPAPVKAIFNGETHLEYDVPFVFAEVNADCIDWLVKADGSHVKIWSDTKKVGRNISTKEIGSRKRLNITNTYKHAEGSDKEREVFTYAVTRDYSRDDDEDLEEEKEEGEEGEEEEVGEGEEGNANSAETEANANSAETEANANSAETEANANSAETEANANSAETEANANSAETEANANSAVTEANANSAEMEANELPGPAGGENEGIPNNIPPRPKVSLRFKEVTKPENGKDVSLKLVVHSKNTVVMPLSVVISVQAMRHNGRAGANIKSEVTEKTLSPGKDLSIPILIPFQLYNKPMLECESLKVSVVVTNKLEPDRPYLAEDDVVLADPPISVTVSGVPRVKQECIYKVVFMNPVDLVLTDCTLTFSGSGLLKDELECEVGVMKPNTRVTGELTLVPYKAGEKTLQVDFNCSIFRDIKGSCTVHVKPPFIPNSW